MDNVLVDTSMIVAYIDNEPGREQIKTELDRLVAEGRAWVCPQVVQEVLQGIDRDGFSRSQFVRRMQKMPEFPAYEIAEEAAYIYRTLTENNVVKKNKAGSSDCLIAAYALRSHFPIFTADEHFNPIKTHVDSNLSFHKIGD